MATTIRPFLMFEGRAEEAMRCYVTLFPGSEIAKVVRYGAGEPGAQGSIKMAEFTVCGQTLMCIDSPMKHKFGFTPSFSLFVSLESEDEIRRVFAVLSEDGTILMPLSNYGFSKLFGWTNDRFGVSWQLNLA